MMPSRQNWANFRKLEISKTSTSQIVQISLYFEMKNFLRKIQMMPVFGNPLLAQNMSNDFLGVCSFN